MTGGADGQLNTQLQLTDHLRTVAGRLAELAPASAAAVDTAALVELLDQDGLRDTWRAMERLDSLDGRQRDLDAAVAAYENTGPVMVGITELDLDAAVHAAAATLGTGPGEPGADHALVRTAVLAALTAAGLDHRS